PGVARRLQGLPGCGDPGPARNLAPLSGRLRGRSRDHATADRGSEARARLSGWRLRRSAPPDRARVHDRTLPDARGPGGRVDTGSRPRPAGPGSGTGDSHQPGLVPVGGGHRARAHRRHLPLPPDRAARRPPAAASGWRAARLPHGRLYGPLALDHRPADRRGANRGPHGRGDRRLIVDVSIALAFAAGLISFASPCVLALVPVYLAFLGETAGAVSAVAVTVPAGSPLDGGGPRLAPTRPVIGQAVLFVLGFSAVFVL